MTNYGLLLPRQLYTEYRTRHLRQFRLLRHVFQIVAIGWGLYVCSSRIVDFKHRFSDVCAGMIIGIVTAIMAVS